MCNMYVINVTNSVNYIFDFYNNWIKIDWVAYTQKGVYNIDYWISI